VDVNRVRENGTGEYWRKETPETMNGSITRQETQPEDGDRKQMNKKGRKLKSWSNYANRERRDNNIN